MPISKTEVFLTDTFLCGRRLSRYLIAVNTTPRYNFVSEEAKGGKRVFTFCEEEIDCHNSIIVFFLPSWDGFNK